MLEFCSVQYYLTCIRLCGKIYTFFGNIPTGLIVCAFVVMPLPCWMIWICFEFIINMVNFLSLFCQLFFFFFFYLSVLLIFPVFCSNCANLFLLLFALVTSGNGSILIRYLQKILDVLFRTNFWTLFVSFRPNFGQKIRTLSVLKHS